MEPKFENHCQLSKRRIRGHLSAAIRWRGLWLYAAVWAVLVLMIVTNFLQGSRGTAVYECILLALTLFLYFVVPRLQAHVRHRRYHYIAFRDAVMKTSFYDEDILCENEGEGQSERVPYKKLRAARPCGDMVILLLKGKGELLLSVDGFEKGNLKALMAFLAAKAPQMKNRL